MKVTSGFLAIKPRELLADFLTRCRDVKPGADIAKIRDIAIHTIKHASGSKRARETTRTQQELELQWYASLKNGGPDYSLYSSDYYLAELFACYAVYSRKHLIDISDPRSLFTRSIVSAIGPVATVLDVGCGLGYATVGLYTLFPNASIIGFDLKQTAQYAFATALSKTYPFTLVSNLVDVRTKVDLVFASEYFEHIINPVDHVKEVIRLFSPRFFLTANSFNSKAIGHFTHYTDGGLPVHETAISKRWHRAMRDHGYVKVKTKLWNSRPAFWMKS